ncbi:MAG TPA: hypothetical protein VH458_03880 [Vicinamibacterales bacterium]|jgi:hypothetical protein
MTDKKDPDDPAARKARADAIRRARDKRKADLTAPNDETPDQPSTGRDPNYVDFIDRKMKRKGAKGC